MPLPPPLLARLCDRTKLPLLRSIREQCSDVDFRFPHVTSGSSFSPSTSGEGARGAVSGAPHNPAPSHVIISGPPDALEKAERLLADMNAKVAEMCEECVLNADPKYHGFLIGRQGTNIAKFRDSHRVHLIFPERGETDPKLASEIRIIGQKAEVTRAKAEMEVMIKQLIDEVEVNVPIRSKLIRELNQYRRTYPNPDLDRVRLILPRPGMQNSTYANKGDSADLTPADTDTEYIKLVGPKAHVEVAQQALLDMINDLTLRTTRRVPITDPTHRQVLGRLRPQLPEFEAQHRVQIHLQLSGLGAQGAYNDSDGPHQNDAEHSDTGQNYGYLVLTGRPDCIEACLESEILPLLPVHETFPMAVEFHRNLLSPPAPTEAQNRINSGKLLASGSRGGGTSNRRGFGARGEALVSGRQKFQQQQSVRGQQYQKQQTTASQPVNKQPEDDSEEPDELLRKVDILRRKYGVWVSLPTRESGQDSIDLRGTPEALATAKVELSRWLSDWQASGYEDHIAFPKRFLGIIRQHRVDIRNKFEVTLRESTLNDLNHSKQGVHEDSSLISTDQYIKPTRKENDGFGGDEVEIDRITDEEGANDGNDSTDGAAKYKAKPADETKEDNTDSKKSECDVDQSSAAKSIDNANAAGATFDSPFGTGDHQLLSTEPVVLVIRGYKEKVSDAKAYLTDLLQSLERQVMDSLNIPREVHPILIGAGQSALHRVQSRFNVTIEFPSRLAKGAAGNTVIVMGEQSNVDEACDYLINRANDLLSREEVRRVTSNANEYEAEQSAAPGGRGSLSSGRGRSSGRVLVGAPWSRSSGFADSTLDLDGDRGRGRGRGRGRAAGPSWPNSSIELSRDLAPAKITNGISLENSAAADADVDCQLNIPMTTRPTGAWSQRISHKNSPVIIGGKDDNGSTDNEVAVLAGKVDNTDVYAVDHNPCSAVHSGIGLKQAT